MQVDEVLGWKYQRDEMRYESDDLCSATVSNKLIGIIPCRVSNVK